MKLAFIIIALILSFSLQAQSNLDVYVYIKEDCPICNHMGRYLEEIQDKFGNEVSYYAVFPQASSSMETAQEFIGKYNLNKFKIVLDSEKNLTREQQASVTPEALVYDNSDNLLYRGRINDSFLKPGRLRHGKIQNDLKSVIENYLSDEPVLEFWPKAIGCYISL